MKKRLIRLGSYLCAVAALAAAWSASARAEGAPPREVKVLIITMFGPEAEPWLATYAFDDSVSLPGLSEDYPALRCTRNDICLLTTGMGHANAAASVLATALAPGLDLRHTWFIVTGIAGIDPTRGTLGSAAWARWLVDSSIAHEIDAREMPRGWQSGYFGILTRGPGNKPKFDYRTEAFRLDEALLQRALALSRGVTLEDSPAAAAYRAHYREPSARAKPQVIQCDTSGGDTWWHGHKLGQHAREWVKLLTDGEGVYCTTQQEDTATYNALVRAAQAGRVDLRRLAVLRTGSNFDRPYLGQSAHASLMASIDGSTGGFPLATRNLVRAARPLVDDIVARWPAWRNGVPAQ